MDRAFARRAGVALAVRRAGFALAALDLEPFRSGRLNEVDGGSAHQLPDSRNCQLGIF